ncbi:MAG: hypothetical protein ACREQK_10495, partial [Candidatus Binatia bacterium]
VYKRSATALFAMLVGVAMALTISVVQFHSPALERYVAARRIGQEVGSIVGNSHLVFSFPKGHSEIIFYLDRSQPVQNIGSADELYRLFTSDEVLFGLLSRETYEILNTRKGLSLVRLADYLDRKSRYVLVTNCKANSPGC